MNNHNTPKILKSPMKTDFFNIPAEPWAAAGIFTFTNPDDELKSSFSSGKLRLARQVHGNDSVWIKPNDTEDPGEADALICSTPGIAVGVRTADCVPILLYAPGVVAAVHAGWRGSLDEIGKKVVKRIQRTLGISPEKIHAYIGPHICTECYEVDAELGARFEEKGFGAAVTKGTSENKCLLDLTEVNRLSLISAGLKAEKITSDERCTRCSMKPEGIPIFPSWRREAGTASRLVTFIELR